MTTPSSHPRTSLESPLAFNLFHRFATSELTHSGIWAWILQSLDDRCPTELEELRPAAQALLAKIGVSEFLSPIEVRRERKLAGVAGRVDIEVLDRDDRVVVIETKVKARPDETQRQRYEDAYRATGKRIAGIAILSTTFDEPWIPHDTKHVGATDLLEILRAGPYQSDTMRQYVTWLEYELARRERIVKSLSTDLPEHCAVTLCDAAAQWGFMRRLGESMGGPDAFELYAGTNLGGSPWTQLAFSRGGLPDFDALFYRLDASPGRPAEFTLRQYQKPVLPGKLERLALLRRLFQTAIEENGSDTVLTTRLKVPSSTTLEAKVAQATIPGTSPLDIAKQLPIIHASFLRRIVDVGWPTIHR